MQYDPSIEGIIFNIQRFSVHDGPGIRTVVFNKGCSLRCIWCSNPESIQQPFQLGVYADRCIGVEECGACIRAASDPDQIVVEDNLVVDIHDRRSEEHLALVDACPCDALKAWGWRTTVGEVMKEVISDKEFYRESGGGMTLSGGEAMLQADFAVELLKAAHCEGINTCIETALNYHRETLERAVPYLDCAYCDLKEMDSDKHKQFTGVANERSLENMKFIVKSGVPVVIRIPVVPDHNGTEENLRATAKFVAEDLHNRVKQIQLLPFRKLGVDKYASLGMEYPLANFESPPREQWEKNLRHFTEMMQELGVPAVAGSGHKVPL